MIDTLGMNDPNVGMTAEVSLTDVSNEIIAGRVNRTKEMNTSHDGHVGGLAAAYQIWHHHLKGNQAEKYWSFFAMFHISKFFRD